jgi:hypothetical protein
MFLPSNDCTPGFDSSRLNPAQKKSTDKNNFISTNVKQDWSAGKENDEVCRV